jgi:hypothetical protein
VFRHLSNVIDRQEFICGDKYLEFAESNDDILYFKRDYLFRHGIWRGRKQLPLYQVFGQLRGQKIVIGHSDLPTPSYISRVLKITSGVVGVFGTNLEPFDGFAQSIPLGLTNPTKESAMHEVLGDTRHFKRAHEVTDFPKNYSPSIFVNFTSSTKPSIRGPLLELLSNLPNSVVVDHDEPSFTDSGRVSFLSKCRMNSFVVCPEGNGIDTHRLWETLYMGGVPIVSSNSYMNGLYRRLPVVVLDDWRQLNEVDFLERAWLEVQDKEWDSDVLMQSFWNKNFLK